jgi:dihydrofolate synthase/folylpolyglutamate synthase
MPKSKGNYRAALKFIYDREHFGIKLGLENISRFLNRIDNPHNNFPSIHIAGTNGKGSTAVDIESILRQAGYKTGIFTSPHLVDFRERIRVNGQQISKQRVTSFINNYKYLISRNKITFFELCTAMAFLTFAQCKVDIAIVETGLGGRLDASNTLSPLLSIITDISFDHVNILGNTLKKIAYEKAGIIKNNTPVLIGIMKPEPKNEIIRIAKKRAAPVIVLKRNDFAQNGFPYKFDYLRNTLNMCSLQSSLPGRHQILNAALAIRAIECLRKNGYKINKNSIRKGLKNANWPGRFQIIKRPGKPTVILDVGHNPAGVKAMADCFREYYPQRKANMVIGFVRNKNLEKSVGHLRTIADQVEIVRLDTYRTAEPEDIARHFGKKKQLRISNSVVESSRRLINSADKNDIIIICGSHFTVGDFLANHKEIL